MNEINIENFWEILVTLCGGGGLLFVVRSWLMSRKSRHQPTPPAARPLPEAKGPSEEEIEEAKEEEVRTDERIQERDRRATELDALDDAGLHAELRKLGALIEEDAEAGSEGND